MSLEDYKLTDAKIQEKGVVNAPDRLTGTAQQNKMLFDRLVREAVKVQFNGLIDELKDNFDEFDFNTEIEAEVQARIRAVIAAIEAGHHPVIQKFKTMYYYNYCMVGSGNQDKTYYFSAHTAIGHYSGRDSTKINYCYLYVDIESDIGYIRFTTDESMFIPTNIVAGVPAFTPTDPAHPATKKYVDDTAETLEEALEEEIGGKYVKPGTGIPKTDLAAAVQQSLGRADSALQSVPNTYRTAAAQDVIDEGKQGKEIEDEEGYFAHTTVEGALAELGAAKLSPDSKTASMTQAVGKDASGKLWTAPGSVKVFTLSSLADYETAAEAVQEVEQSGTAIIRYGVSYGDFARYINYLYQDYLQDDATRKYTFVADHVVPLEDDSSYSEHFRSNLLVEVSDGSVEWISLINDSGRFLDPTKTYDEPFIPTDDGHPATKKYVDDSVLNPVTKTSAMTQAVGKDSAGQLWTAPGGGSGDMLAAVYDPDGAVAEAGGIPAYVDAAIAAAIGNVDTLLGSGVIS